MGRISLLDKIFSASVVLIPILQYYYSPIPPLNMSTFLAVVFVPCFFLTLGRKTYAKRGDWALLPPSLYVLFIVFNTFYTIRLYGYSFSLGNLEGLVRLLVIFFAYLFLGYKHFHFKTAFKVLEIVLLISVVLMIIQAFFSVMGHPISFHIAGLLTDSGYAQAGDRFDGLYMEPAHFAHAAIMYLCIKLLKPGFMTNPFSDVKTIIIALGVILSGSGQGYIFLVIVAAIWFLYSIFGNRALSLNKKILYIFTTVAVCLVLYYVIPEIDYAQRAISRFTDTGEFGGSALVGRTGTDYMFLDMSETQQMFGVGLGHQSDITGQYFTNSLYSHLITYGYPSLFFLALIFLYNFIRRSACSKAFTVIFIIELFFADTAAPSMMCQYLLFTLFEYNYIKDSNKKVQVA